MTPSVDRAGTVAGSRVAIRGLRKSFGAHRALDGIDLDIDAGEVVCLLGPSGSGKSTLLRCINRLEAPDAGMVFIDDAPMGYREHGTDFLELSRREQARQRGTIGMVFQQFNLFAHRTAWENVAEGLVIVQRMRPRDARERALALLERVGLRAKADAYPSELSGGQQQRVAIARSLAASPRLMLFDEPTSALDPELVREVLDVMLELAQSGVTMIVVTHEIGFASKVADRVAYMEEGRIVESGSPAHVIDAPSDQRTQRFMAHVA